MSLRIVHTSDIHIGSKLAFLGVKAEEHRQQIVDTFVKVVDFAIENKADLFLITGDLFDTKFASRSQIILVTEQIFRLTEAGIYVALIPGNHDRYEEGSVYLKSDFANIKSDKFRLFKEANATSWLIASLDTTIHGAAITSQKNKNSQLPSYKKNPDTKYNIGIIHGSVSLQSEADNYPINKEDINKLAYDYLALGDWHSVLDVSTPNASAWYAGSPEILSSSQKNSGNFLFVTIDETTIVTPVAVASKKIKELVIDINQFKNLTEIEKHVLNFKNKDTFLKIIIKGDYSVNFGDNIEELSNDLSRHFFYVEIENQATFKISEEVLGSYPDELVTGRFIRLLLKEKSNDEEKNQLIDEAIQLGVRLLEGKNANS